MSRISLTRPTAPVPDWVQVVARLSYAPVWGTTNVSEHGSSRYWPMAVALPIASILALLLQRRALSQLGRAEELVQLEVVLERRRPRVRPPFSV